MRDTRHSHGKKVSSPPFVERDDMADAMFCTHRAYASREAEVKGKELAKVTEK